MAKELTWKEAINQVLEQYPSGLHYGDITDKILEQKLKSFIGATPSATVNSQIASSIKNDGDASPYVRIDKGIFALKPGLPFQVNTQLSIDSQEKQLEDEAKSQIIESFGMYWRRDLVSWKNNPKLMGQNKEVATQVDFCDQQGIYLLHDGRAIVYVGRSDGSIGRRLFDHTKGRFSFRWDRFSWFGLRPINESGAMGALPKSYSAENMISTLEAILIEIIEPSLNRRRGDDLEAHEYFQVEDSSVKGEKLVLELLSKLKN